MQAHPRTGVALVLTAAALWGTTGTAQSFGSGDLSALWFGALRLVVASLFFAATAAVVARRAGPTRGSPSRALPWSVLAAAGLCMAVYNLAFFAGIQRTGVAVGTAVALGSGPLWAGLLEGLLTRRAPSGRWWLAALVAVTGGATMALAHGGPALRVGTDGVLLCLLSGLSYAGYTLVNKHLVGRVSSSAITLGAFTVAAVIALPAAWLGSGPPVLRTVDTVAVLYVGVVTAGVAYLLFSHALHHVSAATGVTLALCEPVVAFALAMLVIGEPPSWTAFGGLLLVVAGVLGVVRTEVGARRPSGPDRLSAI